MTTASRKKEELRPDEKQIEIMIRSSYPLIYLDTWEEERAIRSLRRIASEMKSELLIWTESEGLRDSQGQKKRAGDASPLAPGMMQDPYLAVLNQMLAERNPTIFVLLDFHPAMGKPAVVRRLRDVVAAFRTSHRTLVILSPVLALPVELEKDITVVEYRLPTADILRQVLERIIGQMPEQGLDVRLNSEDEKEQLIKAMLGLTESQAQNVLAKAIATDSTLSVDDVEVILREKEQIIRKSGILEFYPSGERLEGIGGLDSLKQWFSKRKDTFSDRAQEFGLDAPKGVLLLGVPGCGKSLCAKALAADWDKPLLRFDVGRIFGGLVGKSEENMRLAIQVAESVAPAILWIDEIEKGFAGMGGRGDGGGVVARVFGTLITWMQEKTAPVFIVATANDISQLPPEMLRKGRFDELFFVDLPFADERRDIFSIHLKKRKRDPEYFDLDQLAEQTEQFSGAEIEQVIISALYDAFDEKSDLNTEFLLRSIRETQPLARTMSVQIDALRDWAQNRCRYASSTTPRVSARLGKYSVGAEGTFVLNTTRSETP